MFQQNGMTGEVVAVGLTFGDDWHGPQPAFYAYRGHRPRVGLMWGGFDLSATR